MSLLPTKYVPIEHSLIGVAASVMQEAQPSDTVSTLWDRCKMSQRVRTFDRFAAALTLLYAARIIDLDRGLIRLTGPARRVQ